MQVFDYSALDETLSRIFNSYTYGRRIYRVHKREADEYGVKRARKHKKRKKRAIVDIASISTELDDTMPQKHHNTVNIMANPLKKIMNANLRKTLNMAS